MSQIQETRVMRADDAARYLGIGVSTFWRFAQKGRLPKPIKYSARCSVWRVSDLDAFIERQAHTDEVRG